MAGQENQGIEAGDGKKKRTLVLTEKQVEVVQLALKVLIDTLDNKDISVSIAKSLTRTFQEYAEEVFASVHSQGG
jgi:ATP-dependent Clp protease adapter protein ClpS